MAYNLQRLRCFAVAAELENFSRASQVLNTAQSALSRQIAQLEAELGVRLFDRVGRGVRLSAAGRRMKAIVADVLEAHDRLKAAARAEAAEHLAGSVSVAGAPSQAALLFPRLAARAARDLPRVQVHFSESFALESANLLRSGAADFVIVGVEDMGDDIALTPLFREQVYILGVAPLPQEIATGCSMEQALALPLLLPHAPSLERRHFEIWAERRGITLRVAHEVDQPLLASALARDRQGFLVVPESVIASGMGQDRLAHVPIIGMELEIFLGRLIGRTVTESAAQLERLLRATLPGSVAAVPD